MTSWSLAQSMVRFARYRYCYKETDSERTSSSLSVNPPALTTSTRLPRSDSRSLHSAARSNKVRPRSRSTNRSMSLEAVAVPLATDPKTRTLDAP